MIFYVALDVSADRRKIVGTQADARAINKNFEQIDIPTDKAGLMAFVQGLYEQIDHIEDDAPLNRGGVEECGFLPEPTPQPQPESRAERSVRFEDEFANMPLSLQLHYAALAMEYARDRL